MALKPMNPGAVSTATVVSDLPDMPQDLADRTAVAKWWFDTRLVFQRLLSDIERRRNVGGTEPVTEYSPTWDSITGKPDKFPPEDHSHVAGKATPLVQVVAEDPLVAGTTDPDTGKADIGFHEQTAATFLAGPVIGPPQLPVFRPILLSDLPASVRDIPTGGNPGTLDDLNGGTGAAPTAATLVQQRWGGSFSVVGCPPLDGIEASPPRRWLAQAWAGSTTYVYWYGNATCGGAAVMDAVVSLGGAAAWSPLTGLVTANTGLYRRVTTWADGDPAPETVENGLTAGVNIGTILGGAWEGTRNLTATGDVGTADGECRSGDSTNSSRRTGGLSTTISDECTEQRAIDAQSASLEWGAADYARRTDRTGLSFIAERLRYGVGTPGEGDTMIATDGWTPWGIYEIRVSIQQRAIDSGGELTTGSEWTEIAEIVHRIQANLDGAAKLDWQEAPEPARGYAIRAVLSTPIAPITS